MPVPMWYKPVADALPVPVHHNLWAAAPSGTASFRFVAPYPCKVVEVRTVAGVAPTVAANITDVNKNGTTIFTTQANRPTIAIAATVSNAAVPDAAAATLAKGDVLSFDTDQAGTSTSAVSVVVSIVPIVPV